MEYQSFNLSVQGASHIKNNKVCQDASYSYSDENMSIAIVCDGHGGDDYMRSALGSQYACEAAFECIKEFLSADNIGTFISSEESTKTAMRNLESSIITVWHEKVEDHFKNNPFSDAELAGVSEKARKKYQNNERIEGAYGTTLIAVAVCKDFWIGIHIGDGKCIAIRPNGTFGEPIPWDEACFLNATTSMCDVDALNHFRHIATKRMPVAVFIGSDGIDDCFKSDDQLHSFYKTITYSFANSDKDTAVNELKSYLPTLSAKGSGDDVSIAALINIDKARELDIIKNFSRESERERKKQNAEREAERLAEEKRKVNEEYERREEERRQREAERRRIEEEKRRREEEERKRIEEEKRKREEEERKRKEEEKRKREEEERKRKEEEKRRRDEARYRRDPFKFPKLNRGYNDSGYQVLNSVNYWDETILIQRENEVRIRDRELSEFAKRLEIKENELDMREKRLNEREERLDKREERLYEREDFLEKKQIQIDNHVDQLICPSCRNRTPSTLDHCIRCGKVFSVSNDQKPEKTDDDSTFDDLCENSEINELDTGTGESDIVQNDNENISEINQADELTDKNTVPESDDHNFETQKYAEVQSDFDVVKDMNEEDTILKADEPGESDNGTDIKDNVQSRSEIFLSYSIEEMNYMQRHDDE